MSDIERDLPSLIDRSVKRLFRDQPHAVLRLAGVEAASVRFEDTNLNIPELRADHVFIVEEEGDAAPYALYLEYQLRPDTELLVHWGLKWLGLCRQLPMPVALLVVYLEKSDRATFPSTYERSGGPLRTTLSFDTVRLWEHRDRILSGEWPELAPLLVLCEPHPTEATLAQEVELIHRSGLPRGVQTELMGVAISVASRVFGRDVLRTIFREELAMLDEMENLKELFLETGSFRKWLEDPRVSGEVQARAKAEGKAEGEAEGIAKGKAEGEAEGIAKGKAEAARRMTLAFLSRHFGELPQALVDRITLADAEACQRLFDRALTAASLAELTDTP
jgi:predicted transposase YdaD